MEMLKLVYVQMLSHERDKYVWEDLYSQPWDEIVGRMYLLKAHDQFENKQYMAALMAFEQALLLLGQNNSRGNYYVNALVDKAIVQCFLGQYQAALATFHQALSLTPENAGAVLQVCRRLDGIPLATELAAARVNVLSVKQIAARLDDAYRLLTSGRRTALPRHQTLRATMDWSYSLLSEQERMLFRRLSVFAGGFTLEAAEVICSDEGIAEGEVLDVLARLVDKSLVVVEEREGEIRYRLLETIRQYSQERLWEAGEVARLQERHWTWYTGLIEQAGLELIGPQQVAWFNRFEREHDNLRAALRCLLERGEAGIAARIGGGAFWHFWLYRGYLTEGRNILEPILTQYSQQTSTRAWVLLNAGVVAYYQNDFPRADMLLEESLALSRVLPDRQLIAYVLNTLGYLRHSRGDDEQATMFYEECLPLLRELGDKYVLTLALEVREHFTPPPTPRAILASPTLSQAGSSRTNRFGLTARELEVLQLVTLGLTDAQIAEKLVISPRTVEAHVRSFLSKLGVSSRTAATRFAITHQLVSLDRDQKSV